MAPARSSGRRAQRTHNTRNKQQPPPDTQPLPQQQQPPPAQQPPPPPQQPQAAVDPNVDKLFLDPMSGQPLSLYIEKDVENKEALNEAIVRYGGVVSPGYSGVMYILVDPLKESGQNLFRQYAHKKNKIILNSHWVYHCINDKVLHGFASNWAGCKVTGNEKADAAAQPPAPPQPVVPPPPGPFTSAPLSRNYPYPPPAPMYPPNVYPVHPNPMSHVLPPHPHGQVAQPPNVTPPAQGAPGTQPDPNQPQVGPQMVHGHPMPITASAVDPLHPLAQGQAPPQQDASMQNGQPQQQPVSDAYPAYAGGMPPDPGAPQQAWPPNGMPPQQPHLGPQPPPGYPRYDYRDWNAFPPPPGAGPPGPPPGAMVGQPEYDYRYGREHEQQHWVTDPAAEYYAQQYGAQYAYPPQDHPMAEAGPSTEPVRETTPNRGRKRTRAQQTPAPPANSLVINRRNPPARSPTPPSRIIKSTYGGNLFTSDDVMYLKKYIDYCQEQGLVLSLREICERIAVKAPHHTFYSWRRYCNKHQIRLGGYAMDIPQHDEEEPEPVPGEQLDGHPQQPARVDPEIPQTPQPPVPGANPGSIANAKRAAQGDVQRARSPTPPRALYRSTTGKGVAFTDEDVMFLVRFLEYRKRTGEGKIDMVTFWKDVAQKAPHHSRASWMKFYRRHKHELEHQEGDEPLPPPPNKKMRYTKADDVLLANFFSNKPEGTTDKIFQEFGRKYPHHPWKGWQEHHRIHKTKIDHLITRIHNGEEIDEAEDGPE